jgi:cell division topological specificity factor
MMRGTSNTLAVERLRGIINTGRKQIDEDIMQQIRHEIGSVITKYIDTDPENVEVRVTLKDTTDAKTIQTKEL